MSVVRINLARLKHCSANWRLFAERTATVVLDGVLCGSLLDLGLTLLTGSAKLRHRHMSDS